MEWHRCSHVTQKRFELAQSCLLAKHASDAAIADTASSLCMRTTFLEVTVHRTTMETYMLMAYERLLACCSTCAFLDLMHASTQRQHATAFKNRTQHMGVKLAHPQAHVASVLTPVSIGKLHATVVGNQDQQQD